VRSLEFAFGCGATAATLIPRATAMAPWKSSWGRIGFSSPKLMIGEAAMRAHRDGKGRVFADLWI